MVYRIDQPVAGSSLRRSQPLLQENTESLNTTFGIDHYTFNDTTVNVGNHKQVTNPVQITAPSTTANETKLYTIEPHATIGPMQFTRGQSDAVPTPLTNLNGFILTIPISTPTTILNFAGTPRSNGVAVFQAIFDGATLLSIVQSFSWDGTNLAVSDAASAIRRFLVSGTNLQISSNLELSNVYWSLDFFRCST